MSTVTRTALGRFSGRFIFNDVNEHRNAPARTGYQANSFRAGYGRHGHYSTAFVPFVDGNRPSVRKPRAVNGFSFAGRTECDGPSWIPVVEIWRWVRARESFENGQCRRVDC